MKNNIVYGPEASGKNTDYLNQSIIDWEGKIIVVSGEMELEIVNDFKSIDLAMPNIDFEDVLKEDKIFFKINYNSSPYWNDENIKKMIIYIADYVDKVKEPILIAIDKIDKFNLSGKVKDKSILMTLLELNSSNISTLLILEDLKHLKRQYSNEYSKIMRLSDVICTKDYTEYSGDIRVRFPKSLHKDLAEIANIEGASLNQYIIYELTKVMAIRRSSQNKLK